MLLVLCGETTLNSLSDNSEDNSLALVSELSLMLAYSGEVVVVSGTSGTVSVTLPCNLNDVSTKTD